MPDGGPRCSCSRLRRCDGGSLDVQGRHTSNWLRRSREAPPYLHNMSRFGDVRAQHGTASPPGQAWGPFPDGAEGGQMPATHVSETWDHVCRRRSSLTPLVINNLGSTGLLRILSTSSGRPPQDAGIQSCHWYPPLPT